MKKMGLKSITVKKFKPSGRKGKVDDTNKPNLLAQNFKAEGLREKMVSDMRMNWRNVEFQPKHGNKQARWNCRISGK